MADENKPAFYPRVGRNIAKNFRSAQPPAFIEDPRAMDLPQYGDVDLSVPSRENLEMARRMAERDAQLKRQQQADRSPLEKLAGGLQAGRFMGSALTQAINSLPTRIAKGDEAADKFIQDRIYKPEQPLAYEYAGDIGDFLEKLETEYKIPPLLPEAVALQYLTGPATSQAMKAAGRGVEQAGRAVERSMEPVVRGALEQGGLPREMVMAMGANTQSNVVKPYGGNWLGGGERLGIPENDLGRLKTLAGSEQRIAELQAEVEEATKMGDQGYLNAAMGDLQRVKGYRAVNDWIDRNLTNYVKKEMGTPDDPVRKLAEEGIIHTPLREDLDRMDYLQATRKAEGFPAEGMAQSPLAKQWENLADDAIRVTKAGKIQEAADISDRVLQARMEIDAYTKELDKNFLARMGEHVGNKDFSPKEAEILMRMPEIQKAEILGDTKYKELKENLYQLLAREQGFEKRAGELNPFVAKLDPETRLYSGGVYDLGFDHIVDVLREDVIAGRIRPEQLNKVSMEQAVRRTFEYDQELAKKMNEARQTSRAELPVYKEYPQGLKWVELNRPGDFAAESDAMGHSVRGYEPPEGSPDWTKASGDSGYGGYGLGGWDAIKRGKAKVYSLIDAKGEPHVTIEVGAYPDQLRAGNLKPYTQAALEEAKLLPNGYTDADVRDIEIRMAKENMPKYINQIKGKGNAKPIADYIPFVQDFVRGGNWSDVRDFQNTDLISADKIRQAGWDMTGVDKKYLTKQEYDDLLLNELNKPKGMKRGGVVISNNPDAMMLELNNQKMKNGEPAYAGAGSVIKQGLKAVKPAMEEAERALPLILPRAMPKSKAEINAHAERVARQMMGEHVTSGKAGDTKNLAGRSMKESQRVKNLEYEIVPTKNVPESQPIQSQIGDINVALPGDFTLSDVELKSLMGEPINSRQEGGSRYGLGHLEDELPLFYASNEGPAQMVQNKVSDLYSLYEPERVMGQHMAMGPIATNFAQHFADANLKYTDYSKLRGADMDMFDQIMSQGYEVRKKNKKTGEVTIKVVDFPNWPGIADPQAAYEAMKRNPEMRKFYNRIMQTPKITSPLGFPSGQDVRYAITSPDLRDMEVNLVGHGVGELVPNVNLTDTADHNTYAKGIRGIYKGHQDVLSPFAIAYPDATQHIITHQRPEDFTGTIQKVFPHQRVDQQFIDEMEQYRRRLKELTGKKKGGAVKKAEGGAITGDDLIIEERPL